MFSFGLVNFTCSDCSDWVLLFALSFSYALPLPKAQAVAQETLAVWCSLASRLGIWALKAELEDICFAVLQVCLFELILVSLPSILVGEDVYWWFITNDAFIPFLIIGHNRNKVQCMICSVGTSVKYMILA